MNDEDVEIVLVFNECVEFLFVLELNVDEFLIDDNNLSELVIFDDGDFLTRDVIIGEVEFEIDEGDDELFFPILEHV